MRKRHPESLEWQRDWGIHYIPPDFPDTSWIDHSRYPCTDAYRLDYQLLQELGYGEQVKTYLSLGSGLGRQIILAHKNFPNLREVVAVDREIPLHRTVQSLPNVATEQIRGEIAEVLPKLLGQYHFDAIVFENLPVWPLSYEKKLASPLLAGLLEPGGWLASVGDVRIPWASIDSKLFKSEKSDSNSWSALSALFTLC